MAQARTRAPPSAAPATHAPGRYPGLRVPEGRVDLPKRAAPSTRKSMRRSMPTTNPANTAAAGFLWTAMNPSRVNTALTFASRSTLRARLIPSSWTGATSRPRACLMLWAASMDCCCHSTLVAAPSNWTWTRTKLKAPPASNGIEGRAMNPYSNHQPVDEDLVQRLREKGGL